MMLSHYRITENLGAGGLGAVRRSDDTRLNREIAIDDHDPRR